MGFIAPNGPDDYCCACWGCEDHEHECNLTDDQRRAIEEMWEESFANLFDGTGEKCLTCGLTGGWHTGECYGNPRNL